MGEPWETGERGPEHVTLLQDHPAVQLKAKPGRIRRCITPIKGVASCLVNSAPLVSRFGVPHFDETLEAGTYLQ